LKIINNRYETKFTIIHAVQVALLKCSNTWYGQNKKEITSCIKDELDWALGANYGLDDLDVIAKLLQLCDAYGLDTIETGDTLAVAMEAGVLPFADRKCAVDIVHKRQTRSPFTRRKSSSQSRIPGNHSIY
jgi:aldehyde:ferredoxin oxidoreductase